MWTRLKRTFSGRARNLNFFFPDKSYPEYRVEITFKWLNTFIPKGHIEKRIIHVYIEVFKTPPPPHLKMNKDNGIMKKNKILYFKTFVNDYSGLHHPMQIPIHWLKAVLRPWDIIDHVPKHMERERRGWKLRIRSSTIHSKEFSFSA